MKLHHKTLHILNNRVGELLCGYNITIGRYVYWANTVTGGIYRMTADDLRFGRINGELCARFTDDWISVVTL